MDGALQMGLTPAHLEEMKISILVPIYGVAAYIKECLTSLFEQTYENLEYVFVDDCSPDDSIDILLRLLNHYPKRQQQVRIIHHEHNRGLGAARATALQAATGDFVMVVDSDDVLPLNAVTTLWQKQQETKADMVDGAYCRLLPEGLTSPNLPYHGTKEQMLRLMLMQNVISHQLWGRLVRRSVYTDNDINSIEGINLAEDYAVTPRLLYCSKRAYTDQVVYHYRMNTQSTFADNLARRHIESFLRANGTVCQFFKAHDTKGYYRRALHIGMIRVYHAALQVGIPSGEIAQVTGHRLAAWQNPLCSHSLSPLLRLLYLMEKRFYALVQDLHFGCFHQKEI